MTSILSEIVQLITLCVQSDIILFPLSAAVLCAFGMFLYQVISGRG